MITGELYPIPMLATTAEYLAGRTDAAFMETLSALLGHALGGGLPIADHDAPGVPELGQRDKQ